MENATVTTRKELAIETMEKAVSGMKAQLDFLKDLAVTDVKEAEDNEQLMDVVFKTAYAFLKISNAIEEAN